LQHGLLVVAAWPEHNKQRHKTAKAAKPASTPAPAANTAKKEHVPYSNPQGYNGIGTFLKAMEDKKKGIVREEKHKENEEVLGAPGTGQFIGGKDVRVIEDEGRTGTLS
jgi:hypothetical protein